MHGFCSCCPEGVTYFVWGGWFRTNPILLCRQSLPVEINGTRENFLLHKPTPDISMCSCFLQYCSRTCSVLSVSHPRASIERTAEKESSFPLLVCSGWCLDDLCDPAEEKCALGPVPHRAAKPGLFSFKGPFQSQLFWFYDFCLSVLCTAMYFASPKQLSMPVRLKVFSYFWIVTNQ